MELIEQLGLEKCTEIVASAPETATSFLNEKYYEKWARNSWVVSVNGQWEDCRKPVGLMVDLNGLRSALLGYRRANNIFEVGDHVLPVSSEFANEVCELTEDYLGLDFKIRDQNRALRVHR